MQLLASFAVALILAGTHAAHAAPELEILTDKVTHCGQVKFKYGGGTPPYRFSAATAYIVTQTLMLSDMEGEGNWRCTFPPFNRVSKTPASLTFFLEDAAGEFSTATKLYEVGENVGEGCDGPQNGTFVWMWSPKMNGEPAPLVPQCKSLIFATTMPGNVNKTVNLPLSVTGVVPGGDVWRRTGSPGTPEITAPLNVKEGNQVIFFLRDSEGNDGGSSNLMTVIPGTDCGELYSARQQASAMSGGVIAGIVVGAVAALAIILLALWCFLRWRQQGKTTPMADRAGTPHPAHITSPTQYEPTPFVAPGGAAVMVQSPSDFTPAAHTAPSVGSDMRKSTASSAFMSTNTAARQSMMSGTSGTSGVPFAPGSTVASSQVGSIHDMNPTYHIQDDAGPVNPPPAPVSGPVVEMPPTYNQAWVAEGSVSVPPEKGSQ